MTKTNLPIDQLLSLKGKTALITGAARGIGAAIAERYAEAGANLQLLDVNQETLDALAEKLREQYNCKVETFSVDLAKRAEIKSFWKKLEEAPDILVNNAGIYPGRTFDAADQAFVDNMMQVNLGAVIQMCQEFVERRGKKGGVVINMSSIEAKSAFKEDMVIYATSKSGVMTFTKSLAREYAKHGYKINVIVPGGISTPGVVDVAKDALLHWRLGIIGVGIRFAQRVPVGHFGKPDDVARMALVLASPISDYCTGAEFVVDGGFMVA